MTAMTPGRQASLPLLVVDDAMTAPKRALLHDVVAPLIDRVVPEHADRGVTRTPHAGAVRTDVLVEARDGPVPIRLSVQVTARDVERFGPDVPSDAPAPANPGHATMLGVRGLLLRLAGAPTVPRPVHTASYARITLAGLRMREALGQGVTVHDGIDLHLATPLGTGGVTTHEAPLGSRSRLEIGHVVDRSEDLCQPGPVGIGIYDETRRDTGVRHIEIVIGGPVRRQAFTTLDPIERMRLEAMHPWDPADMTHHPLLPPKGDRT